MDVAQSLIFITSYYNDSTFKIMMLIESDILLKNYAGCNLCMYTKILHYNLIPTIYENFKSIFLLI